MFGITDRRHFMAHAAAGAAVTVPGLSFLTQLRAAAPDMKKKQKILIILWMVGGPATIDIWDMKPGSPNGGEHKPKPTAASGVEISEHLPNVAKQFKHLSVIRSLESTEGDHNRGTYLMHTGRSPNPLVDYPSIGSVTSLKLTPKDLDLPAFISVRGPGIGPGFLGMTFAPFNVQNPGTLPENASSRSDWAFTNLRTCRDISTARRTVRERNQRRINVPIQAFNTSMKASCGMCTEPIDFIRFFPSFCFSSSLRLRVMSPP